MGCEPIENGFVCSRGGGSRKKCVTCGRTADRLCDWPVRRDGKMTTCDRASCRQHSTNVSPKVDYCLVHKNLMERDGPPKLAL